MIWYHLTKQCAQKIDLTKGENRPMIVVLSLVAQGWRHITSFFFNQTAPFADDLVWDWLKHELTLTQWNILALHLLMDFEPQIQSTTLLTSIYSNNNKSPPTTTSLTPPTRTASPPPPPSHHLSHHDHHHHHRNAYSPPYYPYRGRHQSGKHRDLILLSTGAANKVKHQPGRVRLTV